MTGRRAGKESFPAREPREKELRRTLERDFRRHGKRENTHQSFWKWVGLLGMVGWPIAITTVGGVLLGHYLDVRFGTGLQFALLLLTVGVTAGCYIAWRILGSDR
jgi:ATP synthase protein I